MSHPLAPYTKARAPEADKSRLGSKSDHVAPSPQLIPFHILSPPEKERDPFRRLRTLAQAYTPIGPRPMLIEDSSRPRSHQASLHPLGLESRSQQTLSAMIQGFDNNNISTATSNLDCRSEKQESRAGTRKVTSLSAEQLERKRANDREAQRTIHQRTREHIERLEHQVADLKAKGEQYDTVLRKNMALENEIMALKQKLLLANNAHAHVAQTAQAYSDPAEWPVAGSEQQLGVSSGTGERKKPNNKPYRVIKNTISEDLCKGEAADRMAKIRKYQAHPKRSETRMNMSVLSSSGKGLRSKQNYRKI